MRIELNCKRVANLLKTMVNNCCEEGFTAYENIGEMPTLFDINHAIEVLDGTETGILEVVEDEGGTD